AMGAVPTGLLVALAAPPSLPVSWLRGLTEGLAAECVRAGAGVAGGDTSRSSSGLLAVTGLGDLGGRGPVVRSGARPRDEGAVAGRPGHGPGGPPRAGGRPPGPRGAAAPPPPPAPAVRRRARGGQARRHRHDRRERRAARRPGPHRRRQRGPDRRAQKAFARN